MGYHEPFTIVPMAITLPVLSIASDLVITPINSGGTIMAVSVSAATLISGIGTLVGKNSSGTTLFSVPFSAAGATSGTVTNSSIAAGDAIHLGFTGLGIGLTGVVVTIDMKIGTSA